MTPPAECDCHLKGARCVAIAPVRSGRCLCHSVSSSFLVLCILFVLTVSGFLELEWTCSGSHQQVPDGRPGVLSHRSTCMIPSPTKESGDTCSSGLLHE